MAVTGFPLSGSTVSLLLNVTREVLELFTLFEFHLLVVSVDLSETHETVKKAFVPMGLLGMHRTRTFEFDPRVPAR